MAVNSELIETIKASQLPKLSNPNSGDLVHAQGDDLSTTPISYFIEKINNGFNGTLSTTTIVPNIGYFRYKVVDPGTYNNISPNINVTQEEINKNFVVISVRDGLAMKELDPKPQAESKILSWEAKNYNFGSQVFYDGDVYESSESVSPSDIPGTSIKWVIKTHPIDKAHGISSYESVQDIINNKVTRTLTNQLNLSGFIDSSGNINGGGGWTCSDFVKLSNGEKITCKLNIDDNGKSAIAVYDLNHNFISTINNPGFIEREYTATSDCFVRFSHLGDVSEAWILSDKKIRLFFDEKDLDKPDGVASTKSVQNILDNKKTSIYNNLFTIEGYVLPNGILQPSPGSGWWATDYIQLKKGQKASVKSSTDGDDKLRIAVYDAGKAFLQGFPDPVGELQTTVYTAVNDCYIRSSHLGDKTLASITIDGVEIYIATENVDKFGGVASYAYAKSIEDRLGGSGSGSTAIIVDKEAPVNIITVDFTTADPLPESKGTKVTGNGSITMEGIKTDYFMEFEVQGNSSTAYPEKNWTIALYTDSTKTKKVKLRVGGLIEHDEFVFKVNFIDVSHVRNILGNRLWEQMVQTRKIVPKREVDLSYVGKTGLEAYDTGAIGHVDGFPAVININGAFYGIGNFNIGKKKENYNLSNTNPQHLQFEDDGGQMDFTTMANKAYRVPKTATPESEAIINAFKAFAAMPQSQFTAQKDNYLWKPNITDYYLLLNFLNLIDCVGKNGLFTCYDGVHMLFMPYDLDTSMGLHWDGNVYYPGNTNTITASDAPANTKLFWNKIYVAYENDIKNRYSELRSNGVFSDENIYNLSLSLQRKYSQDLVSKDYTKWAIKPSINTNNLTQIVSWVKDRLVYLDNVYQYNV